MPVLFVAVFCQAAAAGSADQGPQRSAEWKLYAAKGEEVSAMFPELPAMSTYDNFERGGTGRRERVIAAYTDGVVLAIYSFGTGTQQNSLKAFAQEMVNSYLPAEGVQYVRDVVVDGVKGVEASLTGAQVPGTVQFFTTGRHSYALVAIGGLRSHPAADRFFSSIQFNAKSGLTEVSDGPGEPVVDRSETALNQKDVSRKPLVVTKPPPAFTGLAEKSATKGIVVVRAVFSANGRVTQIQIVKSVADGLSENAVEAARRIRFIPALRDGRFVSMWMQLEYNFW